MYIKVVFLFLFCLCSWTGAAQGSVKKLKADAEQYYVYEKYRESLNLFLKYQRVKATDTGTRFKIARCYLETNKTAEARKYFEALVEEGKKTPVESYYFMAQSYHVDHSFKEAAKWYKIFLTKTSKKGHKLRAGTKDALRRCVNGFNQSNAGQRVIVENLGELINSKGDDVAPILSPNHNNRIYFSSSRVGNVGGMRLANGLKNEIYGVHKTDMFTASVVNGQWGATKSLNPILNSSKNDVVLGFNSDGSVLYYFKGLDLKSGETFVDTFGLEDTPVQRPYFSSPSIAEKGDVDLLFFNDTTLLFSSDRAGGYGGKDLYITSFSGGQWSKAANLGPTINSPYDEVTPFLAADGRTLYFSSNNLKSMGDLDIFKSRFNDAATTWSEPENLGLPFNSAKSDNYFKLSEDGMNAFFSSARRGGFGKQDIYIGYFSATKGEQRQSKPALFTEVLAAKRLRETGVASYTQVDENLPINAGNSFPDKVVENYEVADLFFGTNGTILTKDNKVKLKPVIELLKKYPSVKLELISHTDPSGQAKFDLYFSAKRAQEVVTYLMGKGVAPGSIFIRGCGATYPMAKNQTEGGVSDVGRKLNRRVNLVFHRTNGQSVTIQKQKEKIPGFLQTKEWSDYSQAVKGLSYKIQIAEIKQMYNGDLLTQLPNATIESSGLKTSYLYTIGLFQNFSSAYILQLELQRQGVPNVFVVPYIDGLRTSVEDARMFTTAYPDLYNYLRSVEK